MTQLPPQQHQWLPPSPDPPPPAEMAPAGKTGVGGTSMTQLVLPVREAIISPLGDVLLRLLTPTHTLHYRVSPSVLITTSKVFSAMLSPTSAFSEAQHFNNSPYSSTQPFVLNLHDDDPAALCILLKALHNHPSVPRELTLKQLAQVAVVVDKYDCSYATRAYGDMWMKGRISTADNPGFEEWLFAAWVWGAQEVFRKAYRKAVVESCVQSSGPGGVDRVPVTKESKGGGVFGEYLPETMLNAILNDRAELLTRLKVVFWNLRLPPDPCCDPVLGFHLFVLVLQYRLLSWNTIEQLDGASVKELAGWVFGEEWFVLAPNFEEHAKECNWLKKLAGEVKLAMGDISKERELWEFRAQEQDCSWNDAVNEVVKACHS